MDFSATRIAVGLPNSDLVQIYPYDSSGIGNPRALGPPGLTPALTKFGMAVAFNGEDMVVVHSRGLCFYTGGPAAAPTWNAWIDNLLDNRDGLTPLPHAAVTDDKRCFMAIGNNVYMFYNGYLRGKMVRPSPVIFLASFGNDVYIGEQRSLTKVNASADVTIPEEISQIVRSSVWALDRTNAAFYYALSNQDNVFNSSAVVARDVTRPDKLAAYGGVIAAGSESSLVLINGGKRVSATGPIGRVVVLPTGVAAYTSGNVLKILS